MKFIVVLLSFCSALAFSSCKNKNTPDITSEEARELAHEAYIYALASVEHNKALHAILTQSGANTFIGKPVLYTPEDTVIVSPNNDTYYSSAVLDIRNEPVIISIPRIRNRYYSIQMLDIFTNCLEYISISEDGEGPANFMIVREGWAGKYPDNIQKIITSPASVVLALTRTQVYSPDDEEARAIFRQYDITPLSRYIQANPPIGEPLSWDREAYDSKSGSIEGFFDMFNYIIQYQNLTEKDRDLIDKYKAIGIDPGKEYRASDLPAGIWEAIEKGAGEAREEIIAAISNRSSDENGWIESPVNAGRWGDDYFTRAIAAWQYIYVNFREEALYYTTYLDQDGNRLNGKDGAYTLSFSPGQIPAPRYFWSFTLYDEKGHLVNNSIGRYAVNSHTTPLQYGNDGSLVIPIGRENPDPENRLNWLPAPEGPFYIIARLYGAPDKGYSLPPVIKLP